LGRHSDAPGLRIPEPERAEVMRLRNFVLIDL
jgi:hypothetical protein